MAQQVQTQIDVPERHRTLVAPLRADERNDNLAHVVTLREANEDGFHCRDIGVRLAVPVEDREVLEDVAELRPRRPLLHARRQNTVRVGAAPGRRRRDARQGRHPLAGLQGQQPAPPRRGGDPAPG